MASVGKPPGDKADNDSTLESATQQVPVVVNGRFDIKKKLGSGSYSDVHLGFDRLVGDNVAVKFEWTKADKGQRLLHEAQLYESLAGSFDAPCLRWWGTESEHNIMVLDLLGPSLEDVFRMCGNRFSLKTVLMLGEQMIDRIQYVHSRGIIHRDIKPNNFLMGVGNHSGRVYVVDFGLSKRYLDTQTGEHIPCARKKGLTGTVRYTSQNVHRGFEPSRRDDLGAIGYVLMYFNRGRLPWQGINARSKRTKQKKIGAKKEEVSHQDLCEDYPKEFATFLEYCDALPYEQEPDYAYLRRLMIDVMLRENIEHDLQFDWMLPQPARETLLTKKARERTGGADIHRAREGGERSRSQRRRKVRDGSASGDAGALKAHVANHKASGEENEYDYGSEDYEEEEEEEEEYEYEYVYSEEEEEESEPDTCEEDVCVPGTT